MYALLSVLNPEDGLHLVHKVPEMDVDPATLEEIETGLLNRAHKMEGDEFMHLEMSDCVNYVFSLPAGKGRDQSLTMVLTVDLDQHENPHLFSGVFEQTIEAFQREPEIHQAFSQPLTPKSTHFTATPSEGASSGNWFAMRGKVGKIMASLYFSLNGKMEKRVKGLYELLVLGRRGAGKSAIVHRLIHQNTVDTHDCTYKYLAPRILTLVYENLDFVAYDVDEEQRIRQALRDGAITPNAIVYVVEANPNLETHLQGVESFERWMESLKKHFTKSVPVLFLVNKVDKYPAYDLDAIRYTYGVEKYGLNARIFPVSAKTKEGLETSFKWLLENVSLSSKG